MSCEKIIWYWPAAMCEVPVAASPRLCATLPSPLMVAYSTREVDGMPLDVPITLFGAGPLGSFGPPAAEAKAVADSTSVAPTSMAARASPNCEMRCIVILLLRLVGPFPRPRGGCDTCPPAQCARCGGGAAGPRCRGGGGARDRPASRRPPARLSCPEYARAAAAAVQRFTLGQIRRG